MARPVKITLRRLRYAERRLLQEKLKDKKLSVRIYERYRIIAEAAQGRSVPDGGCDIYHQV